MKNIKEKLGYTFIVLTGLLVIYLIPYGIINRMEALGTYLNGGMSPSTVKYMSCIKNTGDKNKPTPLCKSIIEEFELK